MIHSHWYLEDRLSIHDAACLYFEIEPSDLEPWIEYGRWNFRDGRVAKLIDLISREVYLCEMRWCINEKIEFDPPLFDEAPGIIFYSCDIDNSKQPHPCDTTLSREWLKSFFEKKKQYPLFLFPKNSTQLETGNDQMQQKFESTRKTENLLQAFTGIAIDAYGYDPESAKSTAPQDIADALAKLGKTFDPKTIRGWLKEGAYLLPSNPHKT